MIDGRLQRAEWGPSGNGALASLLSCAHSIGPAPGDGVCSCLCSCRHVPCLSMAPSGLTASIKHPQYPGIRDALEGKGPQRRPQKRLDRRLGEVAQAVGGGYCRLQMPLSLALGVRKTVAGRRLGALEGGGGSPTFNASLPGTLHGTAPPRLVAGCRAARPSTHAFESGRQRTSRVHVQVGTALGRW